MRLPMTSDRNVKLNFNHSDFNLQCPINDLLETARSRGIYQTMSTSAFLTVSVSCGCGHRVSHPSCSFSMYFKKPLMCCCIHNVRVENRILFILGIISLLLWVFKFSKQHLLLVFLPHVLHPRFQAERSEGRDKDQRLWGRDKLA